MSEEVKLFKKGDKVRCVGPMWSESYYRENEHEVQEDQTDPDYLRFLSENGDPFTWFLGNGWYVEKVEPAPEETPSHRFEVGDTIRLTGPEWEGVIADGELPETVEIAEILEFISSEQETYYTFAGYERSGEWYVDSEEYAAEKVELTPAVAPKPKKDKRTPRAGDQIRVNKRGAIQTEFEKGDLGVIRDETPGPTGYRYVYRIDFVDGSTGELYDDEFKVVDPPIELNPGTEEEPATPVKTSAGPYRYTFVPSEVNPDAIAELFKDMPNTFSLSFSTPSVIEESDPVERPAHYQFPNGVEVLDIIRYLGFLEGSVIKYVARAGRKSPGKRLEDLRKARQCLDTLIADVEDEESEF